MYRRVLFFGVELGEGFVIIFYSGANLKHLIKLDNVLLWLVLNLPPLIEAGSLFQCQLGLRASWVMHGSCREQLFVMGIARKRILSTKGCALISWASLKSWCTFSDVCTLPAAIVCSCIVERNIEKAFWKKKKITYSTAQSGSSLYLEGPAVLAHPWANWICAFPVSALYCLH